MKIERVIIKNFRNLDNFDSMLPDETVVCGLNHIGKTNVLQAIYWCLTDKLLDGSSDIPSIIPHKDRRALVDVTLVLDSGHEIRKTYCEHWGTTRGSDVEQLTGHDTAYYYDRTRITQKYKIQEILNEIIRSPLGDKTISNLKIDPKLDINQALLNPMYLAKILDWKIFRKFLIALVGDVSNSQVIEKHPEFKELATPLSQSGDSTEFLAKKINDDIAQGKVNIASSKQVIGIYSEKQDCTPEELKSANGTLDKLIKMRSALEEGNETSENPLAKEAEEKMRELNNKYHALEQEVVKEDIELSNVFYSQRDQAQAEIGKARVLLNRLQADKETLENSYKQYSSQLASTTSAISAAEDLLKHYREEYLKVSKETNSFSPIICEHCGQVANQSEQDKSDEDFNASKSAKLMKLTELGKAQSTEVSKLKAQKSDLEKKLADNSANSNYSSSLDAQIITASKALALKQEAFNHIVCEKSPKHKQLDELKEELTNAENQWRQIWLADGKSKQDKLAQFELETKSQKEEADAIIAKHNVFEDAQKSIQDETIKLATFNRQQAKLLELKALLAQFIRAKLEMINSSTKTVFPDIDFVLVEENIKEGSFNEVCYPLIKGKKTPFLDGSGAEKILTGLAIVSDIRKALNVDECPVIFDEGETLDYQSIQNLPIECQIITSCVTNEGDYPTIRQINERKIA